MFVINADPEDEPELLTLDARGFEGWQFTEHIEMFTEDPEAAEHLGASRTASCPG